MTASPALRPPGPSARSVSLRIGLVAAAFGAALMVAATAVLLQTREQALARADEQLLRTLSTAETEFNRAILQVDLTLAALPRVLEPARLPGGLDAEVAHAILIELQERQLLFADLALLDETGQTLTTALRATRRSGPELPPGLITRMRTQPVPALMLSDPIVVKSTGERGLLVGRPLDLPGAAPMVALAEVPSELLLPATAANVLSVRGLSVRLERLDGRPLVIQPPDEASLARATPAPRQPSGAAVGNVVVVEGPDGAAVRVASRSSLYPGLELVARRTQLEALAPWHEIARWVVGVAAAFLLLIALAARAAQLNWTRLARARQEAAAAADLLDRALDAMGDAFLLCDADDRVVRWNARYLELYPWQADVIGRGVPFRRLAETGAQERFGHLGPDAQAWLQERLQSRATMAVERAQQLAVHTGMVVSLIERRMPDGGIVSVYHDMTATERQLSRAKQEAEAANAAKSQFLANMSHEIRTPLNAVLGLNQLMLMGPLDAEQKRLASLVRTSGRLLLALINDILDLSRIEAGHFDTRSETFEPGLAAGEVCALLLERATEQKLQLGLDDRVPPGTRLRGDAMRLRQVLLNLVGNALKFTDRGSVTVRLALAGEAAGEAGSTVNLRLEVIDTGIGIPADQLPRLFERFSQIDSSATRRHGGSGLGLAITREVVQRLGGRIEVHSTPGVGSRFMVELPLQRAGPAAEPSAATEPCALPAVREPLQVLVAEDNHVNQVLIEALLAHLGHRARIVGNGREALDALAQGRYDIVLMDMQMPELDGLEATRRIRAMAGDAARVPIVAMTANARDDDRLACRAAGMDAFVSKPIDFDELDATLRALAPEPRAARHMHSG